MSKTRWLAVLVVGFMVAACGEGDGGEETEVAPAECARDSDCESENPCLAAQCLAGVCARPPASDGTACDDENFCTLNDACQAGKCVGQELDMRVILQTFCLVIACDPQEGYAVGFAPNGAACALGKCSQGLCLPQDAD